MSIQFIDLKSQYQTIETKIHDRINRVLKHGQYIMGPEVFELEERLADFVGSKHCISASSGTDTLLIALLALGIGPGDEVITTPFTFFATGEMIALTGAVPIFVDIDPKTYNINTDLIEAAITSKTKAIMPVSIFGQCADFDSINIIAKKYNLPVIEDGAQSFGASYKGRKSCNLSTIGSTSFFPSKPLGCYGDGGALFTNDDNLAKLMREIRVHGQDKRYHHPRLGINGRLDTIQAAILLVKLDIFPFEISARQNIANKYNEILMDKAKTPFIENHNLSVYAQYTLRVSKRNDFQNELNSIGIPTSIHYPIPLHLQPVFKHLNLQSGSFKQAELACEEVISIPMSPYLEDSTVDFIADSILQIA